MDVWSEVVWITWIDSLRDLKRKKEEKKKSSWTKFELLTSDCSEREKHKFKSIKSLVNCKKKKRLLLFMFVGILIMNCFCWNLIVSLITQKYSKWNEDYIDYSFFKYTQIYLTYSKGCLEIIFVFWQKFNTNVFTQLLETAKCELKMLKLIKQY